MQHKHKEGGRDGRELRGDKEKKGKGFSRGEKFPECLGSW